MPFRLKRKEPISDGIRRIAREQLEEALASATAPADAAEAIHDIRKRCKKLRGLIRLVRSDLGDVYAAENAALRDAARGISALRDATVLPKTYDALMNQFGDQVDRREMGQVRRKLTEAKKQLRAEEVDPRVQLGVVADRLREIRQRAEDWPLGDDPAVLWANAKRVYARGRNAMDAAASDPSPEPFHQWRKRAKYHWHHCRLLQGIWKPVMDARAGEAKRLSDLLGDDHDLSVLADGLQRGEDLAIPADRRAVMLGLIEVRRKELQADAFPLGMRLYQEKPKTFARRIAGYWDAWQNESGKKKFRRQLDPTRFAAS